MTPTSRAQLREEILTLQAQGVYTDAQRAAVWGVCRLTAMRRRQQAGILPLIPRRGARFNARHGPGSYLRLQTLLRRRVSNVTIARLFGICTQRASQLKQAYGPRHTPRTRRRQSLHTKVSAWAQYPRRKGPV